MSRARQRMVIVGAVLLAGITVVPAAPSAARGRTVPRGFVGTILNPQIVDNASGRLSSTALDAQLALMARAGVETLRVTLNWAKIEPAPGVYDWSGTDRVTAAAARHGISLLANVLFSPRWASSRPFSFQYGFSAPARPQLYADLMRVLILRYGPRGSFFAANRGLPRVPIRHWQIWNEQAADFFWTNQPWPKTYTAMLRAAYAAVHRADPGAKVVAGSLVGVYRDTPWAEMKALYAAGARRYFDEIAVHPFTIDPQSVTNTVNRVITIIQLVRDEMRRHGDARKPILITEMSWPAALGHVAPSRLLGLETTTKGESLRLSAAYARLGRDNAKLGVTQVDWYTWASFFNSQDPLSDVSYDFAGLMRFSARSGTFSPQPALSAYSLVAAQLEGCKKSSNALHCR